MQVDLYDFDKTVVPYDSALKYWGFCMAHNPWIIVFLPLQFLWGVMMGLKLISVDTCKKVAFLYIRFIDNDKNVKAFWDKYEKDVFDWFKPENRARASVLISASPDFLIEEIARRMKVEYCICTVHERKWGIKQGKVCRKDEKVARFRALLPDAEVVDVYSDNAKHDKYIFALGKRNFLAKKGVLTLINAAPQKDELQAAADVTD